MNMLLDLIWGPNEHVIKCMDFIGNGYNVILRSMDTLLWEE